MRSTSRMAHHPVWAITSYFNPGNYNNRRLNYHRFRSALRVPLITVELSTGSSFDLSPNDADILIQLRSSTVLWHKESLLNVALGSIPSDVPYVAWLDCDIVFDRRDWVDELVSEFKSYSLIQLFSELKDLSVSDSLRTEVLRAAAESPVTGIGVASLVRGTGAPHESFAPKCTRDMRTTSFGIAWAARTELLRRHQFYDAMIIGSGDRALVCAALGSFGAVISSLSLSAARSRHYLKWAGPFYEAIQGNIGHVSGAVVHLWHGEIANRRYKERHEEFARFDFDPAEDLERTPDGLWQWRRPRPELEQLLCTYFKNRKEDFVGE